MIGEIDFRWGGRCFSRLATGFWHHTFSRFERFDGGGLHDGMNGFYINYDRTLWLENCCDEEDEQGLYLNVNYGVTDEDVNSFPASITAGLVYRGALSGRDDDSMGATVVWSDLSDDIPGIDQEDEVHVEAYYRCQFNPNVTIQPTFTFIDEPANAANIPQALVGTLRIIAEF